MNYIGVMHHCSGPGLWDVCHAGRFVFLRSSDPAGDLVRLLKSRGIVDGSVILREGLSGKPCLIADIETGTVLPVTEERRPKRWRPTPRSLRDQTLLDFIGGAR